MSKHVNNGACPKCAEIFNAYPGFHADLRAWFESFQGAHPEAHISCAGRGRLAQEEALKAGASRAWYGKSAHNANAAVDIFENQGDLENIYERAWYDKVLAPALPAWVNWYGAPGAPFPELPHVEIRGWEGMLKAGQLSLVERIA